jgi:hypothetical protein
MMKLDIRYPIQEIKQIDFSDEKTYLKAFAICLGNRPGQIDICDNHKYVSLDGTDVENLIKALQKAVELGWTK